MILYMKKLNSIYAFTLVELIITITILAILSTISYLSFQNYVKDSRNTSRIENINSIKNDLACFMKKLENILFLKNSSL